LGEEADSTRDYGEFVATLLARKPSLSRRLQQVAQYLLNNPEDAAIFTIVEIARRAGVPPSAITRFAKELGFDGFAGLQALFKQRLLGPRMS
jgi:DNA-binding MurR/RpiR family transcriptional regulator